ncbi:GspH/FimT family pseudopilin [Chromobacterium phragmitis]|uniref:Type II secretion system protein H n=1 Tax=Chromobacterium phragmitis TaxID=2202141 RepID=A0A344UKI2_9NEIS|nr:GspH/FimT family protein [Chromobacterium phragmitis]AXE35780.1 hypothetical protein DK843_16600 [Chromobacterium phragmitis]
MRRAQRGVTLIELMVVLALALVLLTQGLPALGRWVVHQQLQGAQDDLHRGLLLARKSAVTRQKTIWVAISGNGLDWRLRVSESEIGADCVAGADLLCVSHADHAGVALDAPGRALPLRLAFTPLRGMPENEDGSPFSELALRLRRAGCQPAELRLLATGLVVNGEVRCP